VSATTGVLDGRGANRPTGKAALKQREDGIHADAHRADDGGKYRRHVEVGAGINMTLPIPLLPATISAMIKPTNDRVMAIFSKAKTWGSDRGMPSLRMMAPRAAPSERSTSTSSRSMVA
jgi:hypothetical protein